MINIRLEYHRLCYQTDTFFSLSLLLGDISDCNILTKKMNKFWSKEPNKKKSDPMYSEVDLHVKFSSVWHFSSHYTNEGD